MTTVALRTHASLIPLPHSPGDRSGGSRGASIAGRQPGRAVGYERVLHQMVRRELPTLAELATWAPPDEPHRTARLTSHAELIGRVLLHHHTVERESLWPALLFAVPRARTAEARDAVDDWTARCARIDHMLRDLATAGRHWNVAATAPARDSFAKGCLALTEAVDAQTAEEERALLPLLDEHLDAGAWTAIAHSAARSAPCRLTTREKLLVLGLALEDSSADDRTRLLGGLSRGTRAAWRLYGGRHYRAAVVRLRGAPPAS